jgi:(2Fe-2S) ferredoxin
MTEGYCARSTQPHGCYIPATIEQRRSTNRESALTTGLGKIENPFMAKFKHHIFVCTNQRTPENPRGCCDPAGLGALQLLFKKELAARGLKGAVRANRAGCLDQCEHGPTVVVYPEAVWYGGVKPEDVVEIVESHIVNGRPVERLLLAEECINTPGCKHKKKSE